MVCAPATKGADYHGVQVLGDLDVVLSCLHNIVNFYFSFFHCFCFGLGIAGRDSYLLHFLSHAVKGLAGTGPFITRQTALVHDITR
jgi:hypothetical protein